MERHQELLKNARWPYKPFWEMEPFFHIKTKGQIESYIYFISNNECKNHFDDFIKSIDHKIKTPGDGYTNYKLNPQQTQLLKNTLGCSKKLDYNELYKDRKNYTLNYSTVIGCEVDE